MIGSSFPINRVTKASPSDPERDPGSAVAIAAFTLVVPGFFAYHVLAGFGLIPLVLRGYSTAIATLVLLPMLFVYVRHALRWGRYTPPVDALFLGFVAYLVLVVAIQTLRGAPTAITSSHLAIAVQFLALFAIFSLVDINDRRFRALYQLSFVAMTTIIFANVSEGSFVVAAIDLGPAEEGQADYQGYAFVYLVTTLFCAVSLRRVVLRVLVYLLATPALFLNGARSEFLGFLVAILLIELCITRRRLLVVAIIAALCVAGAIAVLAFVDMLSNNRVLDLIEYTASDSVSERREAMVLAWRTVSESPLLGDYGSYRVGEYAHNLLSAWVDLGLFGFLYFTCLLALPLVDMGSQIHRRARDPQFVLALTLIVLCVLLFSFAKNFTYQMLPIALGVYSRDCFLRARERALRRRALPNGTDAPPAAARATCP